MNDGFNAMGEPIPESRKSAAYEQVKEMGIDSPDERMKLVNSVASALERDNPFEAQQAALKQLDLTGAYRLMAFLLTSLSD